MPSFWKAVHFTFQCQKWSRLRCQNTFAQDRKHAFLPRITSSIMCRLLFMELCSMIPKVQEILKKKQKQKNCDLKKWFLDFKIGRNTALYNSVIVFTIGLHWFQETLWVSVRDVSMSYFSHLLTSEAIIPPSPITFCLFVCFFQSTYLETWGTQEIIVYVPNSGGRGGSWDLKKKTTEF